MSCDNIISEGCEDTKEACTQTDLSSDDIQKLQDELQSTKLTQNAFNVETRSSTKKLTNLSLFLLVLHQINDYLSTIRIRKLSNFEKLMIVFMKLRLNLDYTDLGYRFHVRTSTISSLFKKVIICLEHTFSNFIHWPDRQSLEAMMPSPFKLLFGDKVSVIIDCFEIKIEKPSMLNAKASTYSHYKSEIDSKNKPAEDQNGIVLEYTEGSTQPYHKKIDFDRMSKYEIIQYFGEKVEKLKAELVPKEMYNDVFDQANNLGEKVGMLKAELAVVQHNAELAEFLLFLRWYVAKMEENYVSNMPTREKYMAEVEKRASSIFPSEIEEDIHFRRWLWMLLAVDENQCHSLGYLRTVLKKDTERYLWFARQMKIYYSVLSDDIHSKSALEIRYMKREKFPEYIKFFNGDLQEAIKSFIQSFDKI